MTKVFMVSLIVIVGVSILLMILVRSGEALAVKYPKSGFTKWWRANIIDQNPWEE